LDFDYPRTLTDFGLPAIDPRSDFPALLRPA